MGSYIPPLITPLGQVDIPLVYPGTFSVANNGVVSALPSVVNTYAELFVYFDVNKIAAGVAAGWYYFVPSSNTAGTVYNNTYTSGTPTTPASLTPFVTTGAGASTNPTGSNITGYQLILPANTLAKRSRLTIEHFLHYSNSAGVKTSNLTLAGTALRTFTPTTTATNFDPTCRVVCMESQTKQLLSPAAATSAPTGTSSSSPVLLTADFTGSVTLAWTAQLAATADFLALMNLSAVHIMGVP